MSASRPVLVSLIEGCTRMKDTHLIIGIESYLGDVIKSIVRCNNDQLDRIESALKVITSNTERIIMTDQDFKKVLDQIDTTTNAIAANTQSISDVTKTVGEEVTTLVAELANAGVPQALVDQAQAAATKLQAAAEAGAAQVVVLQAIAANGAPAVPTPPVPVVV